MKLFTKRAMNQIKQHKLGKNYLDAGTAHMYAQISAFMYVSLSLVMPDLSTPTGGGLFIRWLNQIRPYQALPMGCVIA